MRKTLDFNSIEQPTLELKMRDDDQTTITVCAPTEALIEKLEANRTVISGAVKNSTPEALNTLYTLMADLINCNLEGIKVTAEELRTKYKMELVYAIIFFGAYMDFVDEIKTAKN